MGIHRIADAGLAARIIAADETGPILRSARLASELSQQQVAAQLGVSRAAVTQWETGANEPTLGNLKALCALFEPKPIGNILPEAPRYRSPRVGEARWDLQDRLARIKSLAQALRMAADSVADAEVSEPFAAMAIVIGNHLEELSIQLDAIELGRVTAA